MCEALTTTLLCSKTSSNVTNKLEDFKTSWSDILARVFALGSGATVSALCLERKDSFVFFDNLERQAYCVFLIVVIRDSLLS